MPVLLGLGGILFLIHYNSVAGQGREAQAGDEPTSMLTSLAIMLCWVLAGGEKN